MAPVYGDENANVNVANVVNVKVNIEEQKTTTVLGLKEVAAAASPQKSPLKENALGSPASSRRGRSPAATAAAAVAAPTRPALEPSLEAWAASRSNAAAPSLARNIGPSEREDFPEASVNSRWSRLSRRSSSNRSLSTEQVEAARLAQKRNEVQALMRANERNYRQAIENPQTVTSVAASSRSLQITVPKEFNLSTSNRSVERARHHHDGTDVGTSRSRHGRSKSRGKAWCPQLTVPRGPELSTADRARSRSCSRSCTPMGTPDRHNHSHSRSVSSAGSRHSDLPVREILAMERHNARLAAGRLASESPMRSARSELSPPRTARSRVSASPARSCSDMSLCSVQSRLSRLSRPRSISRPCLSTAEREAQEVEAGRLEATNLLRLNEKNLQKVLAPAKPLNHSERALTVPIQHELRTERRARSRSTSLHSSRSSNMQGSRMDRLPMRERAAVNRHSERLAAAHVMDEAMRSGRGASKEEAAELAKRQALATEKQQRWIRSAPNAVERAQRARLVAQSVHSDLQKVQRQQLCIFDPETLAAEAGDLDDDDNDDDNNNDDDDVAKKAGAAALDDLGGAAGEAVEIAVGAAVEKAAAGDDVGAEVKQQEQQEQDEQSKKEQAEKTGAEEEGKGAEKQEEPELASTRTEVEVEVEVGVEVVKEVEVLEAQGSSNVSTTVTVHDEEGLPSSSPSSSVLEKQAENREQEEQEKIKEEKKEAKEAGEEKEVVVLREEVTTTAVSVSMEATSHSVEEDRAALAAAGVLFGEEEVELLDLDEDAEGRATA